MKLSNFIGSLSVFLIISIAKIGVSSAAISLLTVSDSPVVEKKSRWLITAISIEDMDWRYRCFRYFRRESAVENLVSNGSVGSATLTSQDCPHQGTDVLSLSFRQIPGDYQTKPYSLTLTRQVTPEGNGFFLTTISERDYFLVCRIFVPTLMGIRNPVGTRTMECRGYSMGGQRLDVLFEDLGS